MVELTSASRLSQVTSGSDDFNWIAHWLNGDPVGAEGAAKPSEQLHTGGMKRIVFSLVALGLSCPALAQDLDQTVEQFQQQAEEQRAKQESCIANWNDAQFQAADPILVNERFLLKDGSVQGFNYDPEIVRNNDECLTGDVVSLMDQQNPPGCITPSTVLIPGLDDCQATMYRLEVDGLVLYTKSKSDQNNSLTRNLIGVRRVGY